MPVISITNMTGGRNRGCEALVSSIIYGIGQHFSENEVSINLVTNDPVYDTDFFKKKVDNYVAEGAMPKPQWSTNAQRRYFGLIRSTAKSKALSKVAPRGRYAKTLTSSDLIVATGGDIFTSDYGDFSSHARVFFAGSPVAVLAHTIGPFTSADERKFRELSRTMAIVTVRESESFEYVKSIYPDMPVEQTADVAFLLQPTPADEARRILEDEHHFEIGGRRMVAMSISAGIISFRKDVEGGRYIKEIAAFVDSLNADGVSVVMIPHVQERAARNNDIYACREVLRNCRSPKDNVILAMPLSSSDYKGVIGLCEALVGARTHATIASMSQGVPTVSIAYSRKAWGIMRDYYGADLGSRLTIDVAKLDRDGMLEALAAARANGRTPDTAAEMRRRAGLNFQRIRDFFPKA